MNILSLKLDVIDVGERLRAIDEDYARLIAASMAEHGQMTPIEVRPLPKGQGYALVAGAHRMRALQIAGIADALCTLFDGTELKAQLREVDENLIRHELTELDRGAFLARRKDLYLQLHPETAHGGDRKSDQVAMLGDLISRFTADAAEKVRLSERTIQRSIAIHNRIADRVRRAIAGTWVASNGSKLEELSRMHPVMQERVAEAIPHHPEIRMFSALLSARSGSPAPAPVEADPLDQQFDAFQRLWRRMRPLVRERVREFLRGEDA